MSDDSRSESGLSSTSWETLRPGDRFVVRHRLPAGDVHGLTDVVGELVRVSEDTVTIRTRRRGDVTVARNAVVALKSIPPTPGRRGQPHRAISVEALEQLAVDGFAPITRGTLGSWILRASGGYTGRANSALALGQPDRSPDAALDAVRAWYEQLGMPALVQVPLSPGSAPKDDPLVQEATARGWEWFQLTDFMTAATADVVTAAPKLSTDVELRASSTLSDAWWRLADERMLATPDAAAAVLTGSPEQQFFVLLEDGTPVARARIGFAHGWGGIFAVATRPDARRRGFGAGLVGECARAAQARSIASLYLQVSADNSTAISVYRRLGFTRHHQYVYLRRAATSRPHTGRPHTSRLSAQEIAEISKNRRGDCQSRSC